jgi:hypothetical protein
MVSTDTYCTIINGINKYILYPYKWHQQTQYLLIPFIMVQYVSGDTIYNGIICIWWFHLKWYNMYLLISFIMPKYASVDTIYNSTITIINGFNRYILYHYKWYQQMHIVPLYMVSTDTNCTIISGINRYILYHLIPFIVEQYVFVDTIYNGTICICWYHL